MTTIAAIEKAAAQKGWRIEKSAQSIGVQIYDYCYYWWSVMSDGTCISSHIYSQRTGKSSRNYSRFFSAENKISLTQ